MAGIRPRRRKEGRKEGRRSGRNDFAAAAAEPFIQVAAAAAATARAGRKGGRGSIEKIMESERTNEIVDLARSRRDIINDLDLATRSKGQNSYGQKCACRFPTSLATRGFQVHALYFEWRHWWVAIMSRLRSGEDFGFPVTVEAVLLVNNPLGDVAFLEAWCNSLYWRAWRQPRRDGWLADASLPSCRGRDRVKKQSNQIPFPFAVHAVSI